MFIGSRDWEVSGRRGSGKAGSWCHQKWVSLRLLGLQRRLPPQSGPPVGMGTGCWPRPTYVLSALRPRHGCCHPHQDSGQGSLLPPAALAKLSVLSRPFPNSPTLSPKGQGR